MGEVQTSASRDNVMHIIQGACDDVNAKINTIDRSNYQIIGKTHIRKRALLGVIFFIVLKQNRNGTKIEIYDGYPGLAAQIKDL